MAGFLVSALVGIVCIAITFHAVFKYNKGIF